MELKMLTNLFIMLAVWAQVIVSSATKLYSDCQTVSELIARLELNPEAARYADDNYGQYSGLDILQWSGIRRASTACQISEIAMVGSIYRPMTLPAGYENATDEYWSQTCWLKPLCVIEPTSTMDVARILRIVTFTGTRFSIRGSGHNPNPGFANNNGGILIDLSRLDDINVDTDQGIASIGPGNRWSRVYDFLGKYDKSALGARVTEVGIGGYLLGGGLTWFTSQYGTAATSVKNFEIVLANSSIINANLHDNPELFKSLKGGGPNFGIVTRCDIAIVDNDQVWFESLAYNSTYVRKLLPAVVQYAGTAEMDDRAGLALALAPDLGEVFFIHNSPNRRPAVYAAFYDIPHFRQVLNSTISNWNEMYAAISNVSASPQARWITGSLSSEFDVAILDQSYSALLEEAEQVEKSFNGSLSFTVQPFTRSAVLSSLSNGGNPLGMPKVTQALIAFTLRWQDSSNDAEAFTAIATLEHRLESLAKRTGKLFDFKFMNDAGFNQNVLSSYGATSLQQLKSVSKSCDPYQVFQQLQNDGFLVSKA